MPRLYGEESIVANFRLQTDVITIKANQTFPDVLTAFTICLWFSSSASRYRSSEKTLFTYLPEDRNIGEVYMSLLPNNIIFSVANDLVIATAMVSDILCLHALVVIIDCDVVCLLLFTMARLSSGAPTGASVQLCTEADLCQGAYGL